MAFGFLISIYVLWCSTGYSCSASPRICIAGLGRDKIYIRGEPSSQQGQNTIDWSQGILNQEELISTFAKALCRIADCLPRQELAVVLYPTNQIKQGVAQLYAHLMEFLTKAMKWYREGAVKHIIHSITQPVGIRYKDILESIEDCSRRIDKWAAASAQAELRDMHTLQQRTLSDVETTGVVVQHSALTVDEIMKVVVAMAPQLTQLVVGHLDTNQRVFDLQLSNMLTFTADSPIPDPETSYRYGLLKRNRHKLRSGRSPAFWLSPRLKVWTDSHTSALVIIKGSYSSREQAKDFGINVIEAVRSAAIPVLWVLPDSIQSVSGDITTVDLFKSLVQQAIRLNKVFQSERVCALSCARIQSAVRESEWLDILGSTLAGLPLVYIVFNVGTLGRKVLAQTDDFSWPLAFLSLFQELASRGIQTVLKLVLLSYGEVRFLQMPGVDAPQEFVVNIDTPGRAVAKPRRIGRKNRFIIGGPA